MPKVFINKSDNSVSFIETDKYKIHPSMFNNEDIFLVEVNENCFDGVNSDEWNHMFYDKEHNVLYLDESYIPLKSKRGKEWLIKELTQYSLVPPNARGKDYEELLSHASNYLPQEKITEIMADSILTDDEVQDILGYLNADQ